MKACFCRYPAVHESLAVAYKIPYLSNYSTIHKSAQWLMLYKIFQVTTTLKKNKKITTHNNKKGNNCLAVSTFCELGDALI